MGTPGCRLGAGAGGRPPETREHQSEAGDDPSRAWRRLSQKQERTPSHPRAWRRLSQKQERTLPEPGDASVRSTTPHHPEPRGASVRSRGGDPQVCPSPHVPAAAADTDIFWFASTNKNHNISQLFKATQHRKILAKKPK